MKVRVLSIGVLILAVVCLSFGMIIADRDGANKNAVRGDTKEGEVKIEKEIILSPGFYFLKSGEKTAKLLREGKELRALTQIEKLVSGEVVAGFELPGLWHGEYEVSTDKSNTTFKLQIGNPGSKKTLEDCDTKYNENRNQLHDCLAEVIPLMVKEIGGRETRDLLLDKYSNLVGNQTGCGTWLGAYAQAVYDLHGFEESLSMDYMTCRYSYMHYIIAIDSLKEGNFKQLTNFCRGFQIKGIDLFESRDQCILGYAFAGIFSVNHSIESMIALCQEVTNGYSSFTRMLCYEGVFGAYQMKSGIRPEKIIEGKNSEIIESWTYMEEFPTYEFCDTISKSASLACYRYTLGNYVDEAFYNQDSDYKIKWLISINKYCTLTGSKGCWYGLADAAFKALGNKPYNSFASISERFWGTLLEICEDDGELSAECINRVTLDQINKTFSEELITKWCVYLLKSASYTCNYDEIELYKKRIAPVNQYDPAARRVSDL